MDASFAWPAGTGSVTYDPELTSPEVIMAELLQRTGYRARVADPLSAQ